MPDQDITTQGTAIDVEKVKQEFSLPKEWKIDSNGAMALMAASVMSQNQYARYTSIPIVCKGKECPYVDTCGIAAADIDVDTLKGQRCPMEVQFIIEKFKKYTDELEIDSNAEIDLSLVKEVVDLDTMIRRAELKMAQEGDFEEDVAVSINSQGKIIRRKELRKSVEFKDKMIKKRHDTLQLLHSTRKDKAADHLTIRMDPSTYATMLLEKRRAENIVDAVDTSFTEEHEEGVEDSNE